MIRALILVDLQKGFMPGGSLAVAEGDQLVTIANALVSSKLYDLVVATQDWHPANHSSFKVNDPVNGIWPVHCVQNTESAEFGPGLNPKTWDRVFQKGTNPDVDSYSGFLDNDKKTSTGLDEYLREQGVTDVDVMGLATDYCVKFTALDAIEAGFKTRLLAYASRAVNIQPEDGENALAAVEAAGGVIIRDPKDL